MAGRGPKEAMGEASSPPCFLLCQLKGTTGHVNLKGYGWQGFAQKPISAQKVSVQIR